MSLLTSSETDLAVEVARLRSELAELRVRLAALELSRPDRDRAAAEIRRELSEIWHDGIRFSANDAMQAREHYPGLRAALDAAWIDTAAQLGAWLRQHQGVRDGIVITRCGRDRDGHKWICTRCT